MIYCISKTENFIHAYKLDRDINESDSFSAEIVSLRILTKSVEFKIKRDKIVSDYDREIYKDVIFINSKIYNRYKGLVVRRQM